MKCLSIQQYWAWLVVSGLKDVENREWRAAPGHRGPLLIHAGKTVDAGGLEMLQDVNPEEWQGLVDKGVMSQEGKLLQPRPAMSRGAIVGIVDLVDVVRDSGSPWAMRGQMHLVFERASAFRTAVPWKGQLGLFEVDVDGDVERAIVEVSEDWL